MKKQRILSIMLAALMTATACGTTAQPNGSDETTSTDVTEDTTAGETERADAKDSLPQKNYNGAEFTILYRNEWAYEFVAEEENGDIINDAIFKRNQAVEDRFNVKFNMFGLPGTWNSAEYKNAITNSVVAGDSEYDLITAYQAESVTPAMEGYFMNIYDLPYIDAEKPWWSEKCNTSLTVNDKLFITTGDIAMTLWDNMYVFYFNKKLAEQYNIPDVYQLVKDGKWTIDKLAELSANVSGDINGDTKFDENDLYGFLTSNNNHMRAWIVACETPITRQNSDGLMEACFVTERTQNMLDKLLKLHYSESTYFESPILAEPYKTEEPVIFTSDRALFMSGYLGNASILRNMDTDFGIIPYPKYDENQEEYRTTSHNAVSMMCFPVTVKDPEMSAIITEALCAESYRNVIPQYYDVVLKVKGARDDESAEMIDLIRDSLIFDFGWVHSVPMGSIGGIMQELILGNNSGLASYWAGKENQVLTGLEKINAAYAKAQN